MTDSERIATLEKQVVELREAQAVARAHAHQLIPVDLPVHSHDGRVPLPACNQSPYQHHYTMQSGLCACQDMSWAK